MAQDHEWEDAADDDVLCRCNHYREEHEIHERTRATSIDRAAATLFDLGLLAEAVAISDPVWTIPCRWTFLGEACPCTDFERAEG